MPAAQAFVTSSCYSIRACTYGVPTQQSARPGDCVFVLRTVALIGVLSHSTALRPVILKGAPNLGVPTGRHGRTDRRTLQAAEQLPAAYQRLIDAGRVRDPNGVGAVCCAVIPTIAKAIQEQQWSPLDGGG